MLLYKKRNFFFVFSKESFFLARMLEKKCIYLCTAKHEIFQKPLHTSETLKPHFPYMYVTNIIFEILLYNIKNFYEFELDNKSERINLVIHSLLLVFNNIGNFTVFLKKFYYTIRPLHFFNYWKLEHTEFTKLENLLRK